LPGTDIAEAQRIVLGELPDLPHLPELPARGPGADLVGRGAGLLADLPVELYAARWRLTARPGRDLRLARDLMERDLDQLTAQADGYVGPLKVQAVGPWTLAAALELPRGGPALADPGAVRDLTGALAEGLRGHVAQVAARVPGARPLLQLDEPGLSAVRDGRVPTASGLATVRPVAADDLRAALARVVDEVRAPVVVHCCAPRPPVALIAASGAAAAAVDIDQEPDLDELGAALDRGLGLFAGAAGTDPQMPATAQAVADRVERLWHVLGFAPALLPRQVVVTPACGLAGLGAGRARTLLAACRQAAGEVRDRVGG
ncbi:MAG TPA: methionine synthase, partial [Pilimelia sp.]|nr:methionine synthase [Pilimelia sp.]